jgi:capsular polysaccharide export protein
MTSLSKTVYAYGFSYRKRAMVRHFLPEVRIRHVPFWSCVPKGATVVVWGARDVPGGYMVWRLEDGFLRSVGLGADLVAPMSWVVDTKGIYYDARTPSTLEDILQTSVMDDALLERAKALREKIVALGLTKYNVGSKEWMRPTTEKEVILVVGQVETDAAILYGTVGLDTNMGLLRTVREQNLDAYLVYKPHPDVVAGLRSQGTVTSTNINDYCDAVILHGDMNSVVQGVDRVCVLTSLAGFEAILRGKPVTCYGQPFYAGYGLTQDRIPIPRRTRCLSVDMLVAGVLILYPRYRHRMTHALITPEEALDILNAWQDEPVSKMRRVVQKVWRWIGKRP